MHLRTVSDETRFPKREWSIGMYQGPSPIELTPCAQCSAPVMSRHHVTDVPALFVADPFMINANGSWSMFFEVMNITSGKGEIGCAVCRDAVPSNWHYVGIVLSEPFHLSYPYVFECDGEHYMVPESCKASSLRLYVADEFPTKWRYVGNMLDGYYVDSSLIRIANRWWLFADTSISRSSDTLRLFYADVLLGPWVEHSQSPIIRGDPHVARPAGRVITFNGHVIRFAQDCWPRYGLQVNAFEITSLTLTGYQETKLAAGPILRPTGQGWNSSGMHHVDPHLINDKKWLACTDGSFDI